MSDEDEKPTTAIGKLVVAAVRAFRELNEIRARDGVPYTHEGMKSGVDPKAFSDVCDLLNEAVEKYTGSPAHCHPALYHELRRKEQE